MGKLLSASIATSVAQTHALRGEYQQALALLRRVLELEPTFYRAHVIRGELYVRQRILAEAVGAFEEAARLSGNDAFPRACLGLAYGLSGRTAEARAILREIQAQARERYVSPLLLAYVHAGLGEQDAAFDWLEKAYQDRCPALKMVKVDPLLASLRDDPRFGRLLRRMKLL